MDRAGDAHASIRRRLGRHCSSCVGASPAATTSGRHPIGRQRAPSTACSAIESPPPSPHHRQFSVEAGPAAYDRHRPNVGDRTGLWREIHFCPPTSTGKAPRCRSIPDGLSVVCSRLRKAIGGSSDCGQNPGLGMGTGARTHQAVGIREILGQAKDSEISVAYAAAAALSTFEGRLKVALSLAEWMVRRRVLGGLRRRGSATEAAREVASMGGDVLSERSIQRSESANADATVVVRRTCLHGPFRRRQTAAPLCLTAQSRRVTCVDLEPVSSATPGPVWSASSTMIRTDGVRYSTRAWASTTEPCARGGCSTQTHPRQGNDGGHYTG